MKPTQFIPVLLLVFAASAAFAENKPSHMSALEAALTDCAGKVKMDKEGMPDQKAMAECMKAKGFKGPEADPGAASKPRK